MEKTKFTSLAVLVLSILFAFHAFAEGGKVALVWGNAAYGRKWNQLPACKNDARVMDSILKSIGFDTEFLVDGTLNEMSKSLKRFADKAKGADIAIVYYSGHGTMVNNNYYLIPSKTDFDDNVMISEYFPEQDILTMTKKIKLRLFFYDACRDVSTNVDPTKGKGSTPNISTPTNIGYGNDPEDTRPDGCVWYCAAPDGFRAPAGDKSLSPFTQVLSKYITFSGNFQEIWNYYIKNEYYSLTGMYPAQRDAYSYRLELNPSGKKYEKPVDRPIVNDEKKTKPDDKTYICIKTNVPNAEIVINGEKIDINKSLVYKIGESYMYTVTAEGYKTKMGQFTVTTATPHDLYIELEKPEPASIIIKSNTTADVYWDGKYIGRTPLTYKTTTGSHSVSLKAKGYYGYSSDIDVNQAVTERRIELSKELSWFWDYDDDEQFTIGYSYSPQYQIGLNGLYRFEESRISIGVNIATSTGLFRDFFEDEDKVVSVTVSGGDVHITQTTSVDNGNTSSSTSYQTTIHTESVSLDSYSSEIDPYSEATKYDADFLILGNIGYNLCNGLMIETGLGTALHCDKIYLPHYYAKQTVTVTDLNTGDIVSGPTTEYKLYNSEHWITDNAKWSLALRLGLRAFIPLTKERHDNVFITIGGGYTYLFSNKEYSSWDVNIGIAWTF